MFGSWRLARRVAALLLAAGAVAAAAHERRVVLDLVPSDYGAAAEQFAAGAPAITVDPATARTTIPYVLPGPADRWAGGRAHALRLAVPSGPNRRLRLELRTTETHDVAPPRLAITADGVSRLLQTEPGTGLPPPHAARGVRRRYDVPLPAAARPGPWTLTITNEAGSWVMWERIRLVDESRTLDAAHLWWPGPLPPVSLALLVASLAVLAPGAARPGARWIAGPLLALPVVWLATELARQGAAPFQPRWLILALPWVSLAAYAGLGRLGAVPSSRVRARAAATVDAIAALVATHVLLMLFTGGYRLTLVGATWDASSPVPGAMALLGLVLLRAAVARPVVWTAFPESEPLVVFAAVLAVYLATGRTVEAFDTWAARRVALSILRAGDMDLDEYAGSFGALSARFVNGHLVSGYPVGAALLAVPFFVPAALANLDPEGRAAADGEKLAAAALTALSVVLVHLTARRLTTRPMALVVTAVYALGTTTFSTNSQGLWQHTAVQLALAAAAYGLVRARAEPRWLTLAGFALAFAVVSRPVAALFAVPLGVYAVLHHSRHVWRVALGALPPAAFQVWYDLTYFGELFHHHLPAGVPSRQVPSLWDTPLAEGLAGLLLSPGRGLLVYSPVVLFSLLGLVWVWRRSGDAMLRWLAVGAVLTILIHGKWHFWWGGIVYGPRILGDANPAFALALVSVRDVLTGRVWLRLLFGGVVAWSVVAHGLGAFHDTWGWHICPNPRYVERLWSWSDSPLVRLLKEELVRLEPPTSRTHPRLLAASYRTDVPPPPAARPSQPIEMAITVQNRGGAVWLAHAPHVRGMVTLHWRWVPEGTAPQKPDESFGICSHILPGGQRTLSFIATAPDTPGDYVLEVELASERLSTFSQLGTPPVRIPVRVTRTAASP